MNRDFDAFVAYAKEKLGDVPLPNLVQAYKYARRDEKNKRMDAWKETQRVRRSKGRSRRARNVEQK